MPSWLSSLLFPFTYSVSAVLAGAHHVVTSAGLDPASGLAWAASIALLVLTVRLILLPLVVHQVRLSRAGALAYPAQAEIRRRYAGRTDPESRRRQMAELRAVNAEHGVGTLGCLPLLLQIPVMFALFRVLMDVSAGIGSAAMSGSTVASARGAELFGAGLWQGLDQSGGVASAAVVTVLIIVTGAVTYAANRFLAQANLPAHAFDGPVGQAQRFMPALSAAGIAVSGFALPLGVVLYWLVGALWTAAQQAVVNRWTPTPGSRADAARRERRSRSGRP